MISLLENRKYFWWALWSIYWRQPQFYFFSLPVGRLELLLNTNISLSLKLVINSRQEQSLVFFFFSQHNFAHHSLIRQESYKHMDPAYQVRTFNLCLSSTLHYVETFLMKTRNLKRNESPTCELYDTYDLRASLWVFPKISKTRRSPRKKQRSQDWSEDLKIDQNLLIKLNTQI